MRHHFFPVLSSLLAGHWIYEYFKKSSCSLPEITWKWSRGEDELAIKRKKSHILSFIAINQHAWPPKLRLLRVNAPRRTRTPHCFKIDLHICRLYDISFIFWFSSWLPETDAANFTLTPSVLFQSLFCLHHSADIRRCFIVFSHVQKKIKKFLQVLDKKSFSFYFWQETTMLVEKKNPHKCI